MDFQMLLLKIFVLFVFFIFGSFFLTRLLWYFGIKGRFGTFKKLWHAVAWFLCGLIFIVGFVAIAIKIKV